MTFFSSFYAYFSVSRLHLKNCNFSTDLTQIFTSFLTFDNNPIAAFKIDIFLHFTPLTQKCNFGPFSTNLAQIFTSLQTFDTDHIAFFKIVIFSLIHAFNSKMLLWPLFNQFLLKRCQKKHAIYKKFVSNYCRVTLFYKKSKAKTGNVIFHSLDPKDSKKPKFDHL